MNWMEYTNFSGAFWLRFRELDSLCAFPHDNAACSCTPLNENIVKHVERQKNERFQFQSVFQVCVIFHASDAFVLRKDTLEHHPAAMWVEVPFILLYSQFSVWTPSVVGVRYSVSLGFLETVFSFSTIFILVDFHTKSYRFSKFVSI